MPDQDIAEAERKLKEAYDQFMAQIEVLKKERLEILKKVVGRIEQEKLAEVMKSLQ